MELDALDERRRVAKGSGYGIAHAAHARISSLHEHLVDATSDVCREDVHAPADIRGSVCGLTLGGPLERADR
jgi:hypothetical protein